MDKFVLACVWQHTPSTVLPSFTTALYEEIVDVCVINDTGIDISVHDESSIQSCMFLSGDPAWQVVVPQYWNE